MWTVCCVFSFYTGQSMLFKSALAAGANGYSGISLNFFPWLCVWMNNHRDDPRVEKVHNFLLLTDPLQKLKVFLRIITQSIILQRISTLFIVVPNLLQVVPTEVS